MKWTCIGMMMVSVMCAAEAAGADAPWRVYIGTYTGGESEGVYLLSIDRESGAIESRGLAGAVENPSFLALHPTKPLLFSVGQGRDGSGERLGLATAFAIDPDSGALTLLNQQSTVGGGPCHVTVDRAGRHILVANYGGGSVAVLPIGEDGSLGAATDFVQHEGSSVHPTRQQEAHAHAVRLDAAGKYAFVSDLGMDKIMVYRYNDETGKLEANDPPHASLAPGAGPRHFAFHPSGRFAYVVNELSNTVTAFSYDAAAGRLDAVQTLGTLPDDFEQENTTAEICVHPSGRFVYASNRGHDSIAAFSISPDTGHITALGQTPTGGRTPRNFSLSPDGALLVAANQQSGTVTVFRIDPDAGALTFTGHQADVPTPVCVLFSAQ